MSEEFATFAHALEERSFKRLRVLFYDETPIIKILQSTIFAKRMKTSNLLVALLALLLIFVPIATLKAQTPSEEYGAYIVNGQSHFGHQEDRHFALHSVMKFPQALYVAAYLKQQNLTLSDSVLVQKDSLMADTWSPMLTTFDGTRYFTYGELLKWSLAESDNNASDLLFAACGAPSKVEAHLHSMGFCDVHVRLTEKELHKAPECSAENSATPREIVRLLEWFYLHKDEDERLAYIWNVMANCQTGPKRIAAAAPSSGLLIHKTGSGFPHPDGLQDRNDVGIMVLPDGSHLSLAIFMPRSASEGEVATVAEHGIMHTQADVFLQNMDSNLQHRQTLAILEAIKGDHSQLMAVRHARNMQPMISDNVQTRMLTENLRLYEPKGLQSQSLPVLLYLHGGGWTFGSINSCGRFCNAMAASGMMRVVALDYRLAPEHPFPEGLYDCVDAIKYLIAHADELHIDPSRITIGGDSSGGNLAVATALSEACCGKIASLLLFYPVTKAFDDGSKSWELYGKGYGLDAEIMEAFNRAYTLHTDARSTAISVGLCSDDELQRLPQTLLIAAERDILRDQGKAFAERLGNKVQRIEYKGATHLFITVRGQDAAFERAVKDAISFITRRQ